VRTSRPLSSVDIVIALHRALEAGVEGEALAAHWTHDITTTEYPNRICPNGRTSSQRYELVEAFEVGDTAILCLTWTGVVAADAGPFTAGQTLVAHIAQVVRTRDGKVASIATYDCYEPF
jgi:ketosteroid isomerase-like protein